MMHELDVIELRVAVDAWEAGTIATVLEVGADTVLAEVADDEGRTLQTLVVPNEAAQVVKRADISGHPEMSADVRGRFSSESAA